MGTIFLVYIRVSIEQTWECLARFTRSPIREYGSTLYVGLARAVSPTNTNFRLKVLYHRQCQYTQANEYHFDGANSIETTNHWVYLAAKTWITWKLFKIINRILSSILKCDRAPLTFLLTRLQEALYEDLAV